MLITGTFKSIDNQHTIKVDIYKYDPNDQTTYNISDVKLDENNHFCFAKDPVNIEHNWDDFFSPIITTKCKIKLVTNIWCGDMLYATDYSDIVCRVLRDDVLVFVGYVEPRTYNQDINEQHNDIEIQAVDWLSVVSEYSYGDYIKFANEATIKSFGDIILDINSIPDPNDPTQKTPRQFIFPTTTYTITTFIDTSLTIRYDTGTTTIDVEHQTVNPVYATMPMYNIKISEVAFLGDSEDDAWTYADILEAILKYCNARMVSSNGQNIYILSNDVTGSYNSLYNLNQQSTPEPITLPTELTNGDIANEQVSLDDIYNQIGVTCNISDIDDVIDSPLKEDDLIDDTFSNKQFYMREYSSESESDRFNDLKFAEMQMYYFLRDNHNNRSLPTNFTNIDGNSKLFFRDWYIRYLYNPNWKLNNNYALKDTDDRDANAFSTLMAGYYNPATERYGYPFKVNETNVNQWCITMDLGYRPLVKHLSGDIRPANTNFPTPRTYNVNESQYDWYYGAYFLAMGGSKKYTKTDHTKEGEVSMTNYLVLPVMGQHFGYYANSSNNIGFAELERRLMRYEEKPMCKYESQNAMNLSPQKENITNYIVFDGTIRLNPIWDSYYASSVNQMYYPGDIMRGQEEPVTKYGYDFEDYEDNIAENHGDGEGVQPVRQWAYYDGDKPRRYFQRYVRQVYPTQSYGFSDWETNRNGTSMTVGGDKDMIEQLVPPIDNEHLQLCPYSTTMILNQSGNAIINADDYPVPILCCQLKVGNKYLQESINVSENKMTYQWVTDSSARFSICINPNYENKLLNKNFSIINTITDSMNLQCKGMAIPIKYTDNLNGKVEFTIYGPYNIGYSYSYDDNSSRTMGWTVMNQPNYWYLRPTAHAAWMPILDRVQAIFISNFTCKIVTDNAKNSTKNDNDLMYLSVNNDSFKNDKTDIDFDIYTSISAQEAFKVGVAGGVSYNNTLFGENNRVITTAYADRPEVKYVQTLFDLYSDPKKIIEYDCNFNESLDLIYRMKITSDVMEHLGLESVDTIATSSKLSLYKNRIHINLREI